jgi:rhodanese-related sulfurtransferase
VLGLTSACASTRERIDGNGAVRRVAPDIAFEMMRDSPGLAILDLREPDEFAGPAGHIRGARNLPLADVDRRLQQAGVWRELASLRDATFLVYCREGDSCAEEGIRRFLAAGFRNAVVIDGGIEAWSRAGYAVLSPGPVESLDVTQSDLVPTHWLRLADGKLFEGGRETASGLFVAGRVRGDRFLPMPGVEGEGEFCSSWHRRATQRTRSGWLELRNGQFYADNSPRDPTRPYVRGCMGVDGRFRPESREVQ